MQAEIISVGTELLLGHTVNTDATHVARMLAEQGVDLVRVQTVGDNAQRLEEAVRAALERASLVIATGGLGPTDDDLTRETVARLAGLPLEEDSGSLARLYEYFGDRPLPANERRQALLPRGARPFPNAVGTAPGCAVPVGRDQWVLLLPGPPRELLPMLEAGVRPFLRELCGGVIASFMARVFGMGEGEAAARLGSLTAGSNPTVATYAGDGEMFVRVTAKAADHAAARALAEPVLAEVLRLLGHVVYGVDVPSLEAVVVAELARQGKSLATAESCTGGLIARRITDQSGASQVFGCGLVTYANEAKTRLAGVPEDMLRAHGAVSPQVALAMARGVRESAGADLGLGVTGIAGPGGGTPQKPVGLVHIALADAQGAWLRELRPQGQYPGRDMVRRLSASHALDMVRRRLAGLPVEKWEEPARCLACPAARGYDARHHAAGIVPGAGYPRPCGCGSAFLLWISGRNLSVEIVCPGCGFSRQLSADRLPSRTVIATCPRCACRFRFQPDSGVVEILQGARQERPAAEAPRSAEGEPLSAPAERGQDKREEERTAPDKRDEPWGSAPAQDPLPGEYAREVANPWDSAPVPHGWISAFYQTCMRVMFAAQSFFSCLHSDAAQFRPLAFYLVVSVIQVVTERLWTGLLLSVMAPEAGSDQQLEAMLAMLSPQVNLPMTVLLKTGVSVIQLYVIAALLHVTYGFVTGGRSSFGLLFQVIAYSSAPALLCIVPVLGSLAGLVWMFACVLVGCRAALGLTWAQTLMGFVPVVLLLAPLVIQIAQSIQ